MSVGYDLYPSVDSNGGLNANFLPPNYDSSAPDGVVIANVEQNTLSNRYGTVENALSVVAMFGEEAQFTVGEIVTEETLPSNDLLQCIREQVATTYVRETVASDIVSTAQDDSVMALHSPVHHARHEVGRSWFRRLLPTSERKETAPKFTVRASTLDDIAAIAQVDIEAFGKVYKGDGYEDKTPDELYAEKYDLFKSRWDMVGGSLMPVLLRDGKIVGVVTTCPTNKEPEDFTSWEQTTDGGGLGDTLYDKDGKNAYVVSLSVVPEGSEAKDMLLLHQMGEFLKAGYERAFFESRVPQFRNWVSQLAEKDAESYSGEELDALAEQYFGLRIDKQIKQSRPHPLLRRLGNQGGDAVITKKVPFDPLLRLYERIGCKLVKILPNAYQDEESMNYGVVCVYDGEGLFDGTDLPFRIPRNRITSKILGRVLQAASKSQKMTEKIF